MIQLCKDKVYTFIPLPEEAGFYGPLKDVPHDAFDDSFQFCMFFAFARKVNSFEPPSELRIKAVRNNEEIEVILFPLPGNFYKTEIPDIGNFYFCAEPANPRHTPTKKIVFEDEDRREDEHVVLYTLHPVNADFFEQACREHHFFFVGN